MTLKTLMRKRQMNQETLARKVGRAQATVSRWTAELLLPPAGVAAKIGQALNAEVNWQAYARKRMQFKIKQPRGVAHVEDRVESDATPAAEAGSIWP